MSWTEAQLADFEARRSPDGRKTSATVRRKRSRLARTLPAPSELAIHVAVAGHLRARADAHVWWFHPANGEHRDPRTGAKLRAMGVQPGTPDLLLLIGGRLHALELKRHDGRLSPQQRACHRAITVAGGFVATAWDVDSALAILEAWGAFAQTAMAEAAL